MNIIATNILKAALVLVIMGSINHGWSQKTKIDMDEMMVPPMPAEEFFRNPDRTAYQISPDGKHYSYLAPFETRKNIFVEEIETGRMKQLTFQVDRDISGYFWANEDQLIYVRDDGGDENWYLVITDVKTGKERPLTKMEGVRTQIIDHLEDFPSEMIVGLNNRNPQIFDAYRLNLNTGELTMIAENPGNITGWMTDHEGNLRVATSTDGVNSSILYREKEGDEWKTVLTTNFKESLDPQFFTFDNKNIYATSNIGRDKSAAIVFDIAKGKEIEVLYENKHNDVSAIAYSRKRKVITSAIYTAEKTERQFFDPEVEHIYNRLRDEIPGYEVAITSLDREEEKYIVRAYSDRTMGYYYIYNKVTDQIQRIAELSPWIDENFMSTMQPIKYTSRDGLTIHGYLTMPKGAKEEGKVPLVVNVHGGPWARDHWGFNPEVQFLANHGYAVLQVNFRGSTSYGRAFWEASFGQWGLKMQEDVQDGAKWLIDQGIVDPSRVAIYGASYGGYATLQGLVKDPDFYACGVDYVGVSNLFTFMNGIPPYWKPYLQMMHEMVGNPSDEQDSLRMAMTSPALNADKIKSPLFIAQGANDPRVVKSESDQMVEALRDRDVKVIYMVKDNEGHGFHNEENKFEFYREMQRFLMANIGGR
ncbi:MAG: S9 family peptidase [Flavobacteriales bacterium]